MNNDPDLLLDSSEIRRRSLSSWDNEGGALTSLPQGTHADMPDMTNAELVLLRIRVIALENLVIAVLAEGSDRQLEIAREMVKYIQPRSGFTHHPLTIRAGEHMTDIAARAAHFRKVQLE
ncbi:MAG: hypothetical protein ACI82A_002041 [Candidatus Azotimanducaceae bacterium]|jgi:hypothetical protein